VTADEESIAPMMTASVWKRSRQASNRNEAKEAVMKYLMDRRSINEFGAEL